MLNNKKALYIMLTAFILSGCNNQAQRQTLLVSSGQSLPQVNYNAVECIYSEINKTSSTQASASFSYETIFLDSDTQGIIKEIYAYNRMEVKEGDLLAEIVFDNTQLNTEAEKLRININNQEKLLENEKTIQQERIVLMMEELRGMKPQEASIQQLKIEKVKCEYEYSVYNLQKKIDKLKIELNYIEKKMSGLKITSPFEGIVYDVAYLNPGDFIDNNTQLMIIYNIDDFTLQINSETGLFRYNSEVEIEILNYEKTFTGRVVTDTSVINSQGPKRHTIIFDEKPENFYGLHNRRLLVTGSSYELSDVLILPSKAIYYEGVKRYVFLLENNIIKKRYVQVGLNNNTITQILSGVNQGDFVLE